MTDFNYTNSTSSNEYDEKWIKDTWGWDTPEYFIKTQGKSLRPRIVASIKTAGLKPGMEILDVGCGRGEVVLYCARKGIKAVGVDYSAAAIKIAKLAKNEHSKKERSMMTFVHGDINNIKETKSYDRIFLLDFVEHLHDWELSNIFKKCNKLLKPSGALIIHTLPNKWLYDVTYTKLLRFIVPSLPKNPRSEKEKKIHINEMTIVHLNNILQESGFKSKIWLSDLIVEQAKWHAKHPLQDLRNKLYHWLNKPIIGTFYKMLALTPLRLLIVNEMFAVAMKENDMDTIHIKSRPRTEQLTIYIMNRLKK